MAVARQLTKDASASVRGLVNLSAQKLGAGPKTVDGLISLGSVTAVDGSFSGTLSTTTPTLAGHAATKGYVDGVVAPLATSASVTSAIAAAVAPLATSAAVSSSISAAVSPLATSASVANAISKAHDAVTLGASTNGLALSAQSLQLGLASGGSAGAMSSADFTKLAGITGSHTGSNTGDVTLGTANGLGLVGQVLSLALASGSAAGSMSSGDFTKLAAISGTNTGDWTIGTANGLSLVGSALSLGLASGTSAGALSSANFTKLSTLSGTNSGDVTLGAIGASPNANGASISGQVLTFQPADGTYGGALTAVAQVIAGQKSFSSTIVSTVAAGMAALTMAVGAKINFGGFSIDGTSSILNVPTNISCSGQVFSGGAFAFVMNSGSKFATVSNGARGITDDGANVSMFGSPLKLLGVTGLTAFAGGGQASAIALTSQVNYVTTVATAGDSVKLPSGALGLPIFVFNDGANAVNVFPFLGGTIDSLAVNAAYSLAAGATREFWSKSTTLWRSR